VSFHDSGSEPRQHPTITYSGTDTGAYQEQVEIGGEALSVDLRSVEEYATGSDGESHIALPTLMNRWLNKQGRTGAKDQERVYGQGIRISCSGGFAIRKSVDPVSASSFILQGRSG